MDFATQLRVMRAARGLSQRELAIAADIPEYSITWIESGRMLPTQEYEARIRAALNWPADADEAFAILAGEKEKSHV